MTMFSTSSMPEVPAYQTFTFSRPLISSKIGLASSCLERRASPDRYTTRNWLATGGKKWGRHLAPERVFGGGSANWQWAYASAIGEAVERTSLSNYNPNDFTVLPFEQMPLSFSSAKELLFYLDSQYADPTFPIAKPDFEKPIAWVKGWSLADRAEAYLPASLVYLPYRHLSQEPIFTDLISTGTSCARTKDKAAALAILELVERDAWTMVWETRAKVAEIHPDEIKAVPAVVAAEQNGLQLRAFNLTNDTNIPAVIAIAINETSLPALAIGTAARLSPYEALERAISEAITSWRSTAYLCVNGIRKLDAESLQNRRHTDFSLQSLFYADPQNSHHFSFLLQQNSNYVGLEALVPEQYNQGDLRQLRKLLTDSGHNVCLFNLTQCEAEEVGLYVVRAVSTSLIRQSLGLLRPLAHPRLLNIPKKLGRIAEDLNVKDLLQSSHPFP
ncbi:YcaO-like family protein [Rhizobium leguminosarum]|uniref:YcaO-like family protein n=1 Tax=Rhizobium leguminosarum TaxID=384 RepID=UPI00124ADD26|nr:YcaO-like family protein [Rhizobium leguminosarum]